MLGSVDDSSVQLPATQGSVLEWLRIGCAAQVAGVAPAESLHVTESPPLHSDSSSVTSPPLLSGRSRGRSRTCALLPKFATDARAARPGDMAWARQNS